MTAHSLPSARRHPPPLLLLALGLVLLAATAIAALAIGRAMLSPGEVIAVLARSLRGDGDVPLASRTIVMGVRLPRVAAAAMIGAALAVSGAAYQGLFRNPMVSPDILGASTGASFGAALALLVSANRSGVQAAAFAGGVIAVLLTYASARSIGRGTNQVLLLVLCGMIVSALFQAFVSAVKYTADPDSKLPEITYWLMGSLMGASWSQIALAAPFIVIGSGGIVVLRWRLNVLALSEDEARAAGVDVRSLRITLIVCATVVTASVISLCGQVGWIGLIVPHAARMLTGSDNRYLIPVCLLLGASIMIFIDTVARTITASEVPVSVVTAIVGAPFFITLLRRTGGVQT